MTKLHYKAVAAAAVTALFAAAPAQAFVYSTSALDIANLNVVVLNTLPAPPNSTQVTSFSFDTTNTAVLNGNSVVNTASCFGNLSSNTCNPVAPVLNPAVSNAGGSTVNRAEDNFAFLGSNNVDTYSNSDSVINTAALVTGPPTATQQIAESLLNINGNAKANTEILSTTNLSWVINNQNFGAALTLNFNADPDQEATINNLLNGLYSSQTSMKVQFTLTGAGGSVTWSPNGTAGNDCVVSGLVGVTCQEIADDLDLNTTLSVGSNPSTVTNSMENALTYGAFGIRIAGLGIGDFSLGLQAQTSTAINLNVVPEPASLALLGLALVGLGATSRRRRSAV